MSSSSSSRPDRPTRQRREPGRGPDGARNLDIGRFVATMFATVAITVLSGSGCGVGSNDRATLAPPSTSSESTTASSTTDATTGTDDTTPTTRTQQDPVTTAPVDGSTTSPLPPGETAAEQRSRLIGVYESMGLSKPQASCLADEFVRFSAANGSAPQTSDILEFFSKCKISSADLDRVTGGGT